MRQEAVLLILSERAAQGQQRDAANAAEHREDAARRLWAVRQSAGAYARALCKWVLLAGSTGLLCGALGAAFHHAVELVR